MIQLPGLELLVGGECFYELIWVKRRPATAARTSRFWPRSARWCCRRSNATGRSKLGSSMIRAFPRRDGIRSGLHGNIAASWASETIVAEMMDVLADLPLICHPGTSWE